jgi:hypothetical protein
MMTPIGTPQSQRMMLFMEHLVVWMQQDRQGCAARGTDKGENKSRPAS